MKRFALAAFAALLIVTPAIAGTPGYQLCDANGNCVTVTGNKLDTNATVSGGATATNQTAVQGAPTATPPTVLNYNQTFDKNGLTLDYTLPAQTYQSDTFTNINSNTTTIVKGAAGTLSRICWNKKGASSNIATVYDNPSTSGTVIAVIDTTSVTPGSCEIFGITFTTGLTIITGTGTAADMTIVYR